MNVPIIACKNLTMRYGAHTAIENLSFSVESGDYVCIVGENGSGKSTLVKALLGLQQPRAGEIVMNGVTPREIGYLPQQSMAQRNFPASVWEVVLSGCLGAHGHSPFYSAADKARAQTALAQLGIPDLKKRSFSALSGGQHQRVLLARALCATDKLLLLDEPAAALDPSAAAELYDIIDHLNKQHGVTILMVLHDLQAARRADKILHMANGCAFFGAAGDYYQSDAARRFLGGNQAQDKRPRPD
ncbi:MAG: metal ABC transporter ATP-binding protein [Candidatus Fimivivens sp.]